MRRQKQAHELKGTADTDVRFWAGAPFQNRANAPFRVLQNGELYATAGNLAGWKILTDRLEKENGLNKFIISPEDESIRFIYDGDDKVVLQNAPLPLLSDLVNPNTETFSLGIYKQVTDLIEVEQGIWRGSGSILSPNSFTIPNSSYRVALGFYLPERMSIYGQLWLADNSGTRLELIKAVSRSAGIEPIIFYEVSTLRAISSGTYRILFDYEITGNDNYDPVTIGYGGTSKNYLTYTQELNGTIIGSNGIATFWNSLKYMYVSAIESFFIQICGNGKLTSSNGSGIRFDGTDVRLLGNQHDHKYNYQAIGWAHRVLDFNSKTTILKFSSSSYYAILPALGSVQSAMQLSVGTPFSFMYRIIASAGSLTSRVYGRNTTTGHSGSQYPILLNNNGGDSVYLGFGQGDALVLELVYNGSDYFAYILSYRT